jgi:hypothetical protein
MDLATSQFPVAWIPPFEGGPLPVKLMQFTGSVDNEKVQLQWKVSSNETGSHFEIQKSANGTDFTAQALLFTTDKAGEEVYRFTDEAPAAGSVYYRLKIVDKDHFSTYSNVVFFNAKAKELSSLRLLQNPVRSDIGFHYTAAENTVVDVTVYSFAGVKIISQKQSLQKGVNSLHISLGNMLPKGMYLLELREGNSRQVVRFIKE